MVSIKKTVAVLMLIGTAAIANANDGMSVEVGEGTYASLYKLAVQKTWETGWSLLSDNHIFTYWETSIADLTGRKYQHIDGQTKSVADLGLTPVLRWQRDTNEGIFGEVGIGVNYFSDIYNNDGLVMGSRFQFGDHVGIGCQLNKNVEITVKFQHFSNAGIKEPNPSVNFGTIKLAYAF